MNATKGLFRLVGGKISKDGPVVLNTPTATIGIRGGIILVGVADNGATQATFLFGQSMDVTSGGVTKEVSRPGFAIAVDSADQAPSDPAPVSADSLAAALGGLEGSEGESGGTDDTPQDSDVAASGIGEAGSDQAPADIAPQDLASLSDLQDLGNSADDAEDTAEQDEASQNTATESSTGLTLSGFSGRYKHSKLLGSSAATLGTGDGVGTFDIAFSGASISSGTFLADSRVEDWRASLRVRWLFRRFRSGPQSGSHGHVSSPRSSNRTCGFPASGFRTRSCLRARKAQCVPRQTGEAVFFV